MKTKTQNDPVVIAFLEAIGPVRFRIQQVILFGSRARGSERLDSDYDLLVVVAKKDDALLDVLYEAVIDVLLNHGRLISLKIFEEAEFLRLQALQTPFIKTVMEQGVPLG